MGYNDAPEGWWREFIAATPPHTGKLAVTRKDGSPHVSPIWVDLDGDDLVFTTYAPSIKGKSIARDGRVSICFDNERPPFDFVTVTGTATTTDDPETVRYWAGRLGARYMGADRAEEFAKRNGGEGELLVRVKIDKVVAKTDVAD
ncbi:MULTISPECIES: PPOX class F420-dependent oxidoreductase [unclassified Crossiella]|uniref:PPOX class F420-dependent oxidoreductase n=1 Tax=unclassified Crossiella TaxID=2620835 RepID=UPI001FFFD9CF|nr:MULTISPECIES: PPOX class F420-dependent oxidoreductase [unclassified Crossiella]MCK2236316.1 PPOX class F420-dependent oxidoreductase [Crossiella sp. S99.2]MCK2249983.1 PPOX class F420-dependent oxidoreductase [Crossiella sp. S99.1]